MTLNEHKMIEDSCMEGGSMIVINCKDGWANLWIKIRIEKQEVLSEGRGWS